MRDSIPVLAIFVVFGLLFTGMWWFTSWMDERTPEEAAAAEASWKREQIVRAHSLVSDLVFIQHGPSGPCFAVRGYYESSVVAWLPCDQVPAGRLEHLDAQP